MKRLLYGLGLVLLLSGFVQADDSSGVSVVTMAKSSMSWDGTPLPAYPKGTPEVTILKITIPPKTTLPLHEHPVINAGVLLRGELKVVAEDGKELLLKAGDPIIEVVNKWHYGQNTGDGPAEIMVFYVGTPDTPITVKKQAASQ